MDEESAVAWWLTGGWQAMLSTPKSMQSNKPAKEKAPPRTQPRTPLQRFRGTLAAELGIEM